jgi:hypothetical protein
MGFKMKGFSPFTKVSGKEYRQMRRDKYEDYQDEAKEAKKEDRRERRSLRKSQRQEHGLLGARGERRSEKKALKARQLADRYDAKADYMSELKSDRKTIGGRRHLPWNWSSRPEDPAKQSFYGDGAKSASAFPKSESNYEGGVMKQTYGTVSPMKKNDKKVPKIKKKSPHDTVKMLENKVSNGTATKTDIIKLKKLKKSMETGPGSYGNEQWDKE